MTAKVSCSRICFSGIINPADFLIDLDFIQTLYNKDELWFWKTKIRVRRFRSRL